MSTIIRRKRASRLSIGPYRRHELLTGRIQYPVQGYTGYGDGIGTDLTEFITDQMRADWEANRAELMAFWRRASRRPTPFPTCSRGCTAAAVRTRYRGRRGIWTITVAQRAMPEPDPLQGDFRRPRPPRRASADVRFEARYGLKSDIAPRPRSATGGLGAYSGPSPVETNAIAFCSTSKMTAVDHPNISAPFIAAMGPSNCQRSTGRTSP